MIVSVNGKALALKNGSSFEYISENRLFTGSDGYTLSISFPLKDCKENIAIFGNINRMDVAIGDIVFDCEIRDKNFYKFGSLTIVELSESEVKCQFLEGRSESNYNKTFDDVYINELDLGAPEITDPAKIDPMVAISAVGSGTKYVALPWVNNNSESGLPHNFVDLHEGDTKFQNYYTWNEDTDILTWQPYLIYILEKMGEAIGYDMDIDEIKRNQATAYLLICNTLPGAWDIKEFARALPHWTVDEFLSKLELFLNGEFKIDHRSKSISFKFMKDIINDVNTVYIDRVIEAHSAEVDFDDPDCEFRDVKNYVYKGDDSDCWKYYSCDWFIKERLKSVVKYDTFTQLVNENKWLATWENSSNRRGSNFNKLMYAADIDTYFIVRAVSCKPKWDLPILGPSPIDVYKCILQPVNIFGKRFPNNEDENTEELDIMPVPIDYTDDVFKYCMFLNVGSFSESEKSILDIPTRDMSGTQASLLAGSSDKGKSEYFDCIYMAWWTGMDFPVDKLPYPIVDRYRIKDDWTAENINLWFNLRLNGENSAMAITHKIDPKVKYTFKFISDVLPDPMAVFIISGKKYICEKLTATFTEKGMSQLIKGEFYPIID